MKLGMRKVSLKKSISARISPKRNLVHRAKLKMPKGKGWIRDPKKSIYNKIYNKTTFSIRDLFK